MDCVIQRVAFFFTALLTLVLGQGSVDSIALKFLVHIRMPYAASSMFPKNVNQKHYNCVGVLVSSQHVLTAAHCVANNRSKLAAEPDQFKVELGIPGSASFTGPIPVRTIAIAHGYIGRAGYYVHDLALLTLSRPVDSSHFQPIELREYVKITTERQVPKEYSKVLAVRWNRSMDTGNSNGAQSSETRRPNGISLKVIPPEECGIRRFACDPRTYPEHKLCTESATDAIKSGDSGGPLISKLPSGQIVLDGILSYTFVNTCEEDGVGQSVTVFARVSQYLPWIGASMLELTNRAAAVARNGTDTAKILAGN